jgi:HEAT repeat protein
MEPLLTEQALATKKGVAVAAKLLNEVSGEGYYLDEDEDDEDDEEQEAPPDAIPGLDAPPDDPDDDPEEAQYLARKLARFAFRKDPRWGAVALRLLAHKELGESCVVLLGNLRDPRGKAPLVGLLRDNLHAHGAAHALALLHDRSVIPDLIGLLKQKKINPSVISLLGTFKAAEAIDPLCDLLARENDQTNLIFDALRRIGDPRAAAPVARALLQKGVTSYPYQALRALRQFDDPAAVPHLQEALKKAKKSRNSWVVTQYEELITYLERDRKV